MTDTTIFPCPFCGGTDISVDHAGRETHYFVQCNDCDVVQDYDHGYSQAEALTAWNTRANADARLVEALRDCLAVLTDPIVGTIYQDDPAWFEALDRAVAKARAALSEVSHG